MKKGIIAIIIILVCVCVCFIVYAKINQPIAAHDGIEGVITFEKLSNSPIGYGVEFKESEIPFNIELTSGTLKLEVLRNGNLVFESEFDLSESTIINIPEDGLYLIQISGKKATGTIRYEVNDSEETNVTEAEVTSLVKNTKDEPARESVLKFLKEIFVEDVEDIKIKDFKLYTEKEMEEDELLKEALAENKLAFEVSYEIILKDGADGMQYTVATGVQEGNVIKDKSNVGYLTEKNGKYEVVKESFGTGF